MNKIYSLIKKAMNPNTTVEILDIIICWSVATIIAETAKGEVVEYNYPIEQIMNVDVSPGETAIIRKRFMRPPRIIGRAKT